MKDYKGFTSEEAKVALLSENPEDSSALVVRMMQIKNAAIQPRKDPTTSVTRDVSGFLECRLKLRGLI